MAYCVLVIDLPNLSIKQINADITPDATKPREGLEASRQLLESILSRTSNEASIQWTSTSSAPTVTPSGTGAIQVTWNML
jgi:hypothetical protein